MSVVQEALTVYLKKQANALGEPGHLRYSSDLDPEACERAIVYRLSGAPRDAAKLGDELRFFGGRIFERTVLDSLRAAGHEAHTQTPIRPLRPSAWAWATGHSDILLAKEKRLIEVKAPRGNAFEWAENDPTRLVREGYKWQLSTYFHELKALGVVESAGWIFLDREGSHMPVEVELSGALLIPLERIIDQEVLRSRLIADARNGKKPPRLPREIKVSVAKGRGKPSLVAKAYRQWRCSYCTFSETCKPGYESVDYALSSMERDQVLAQAAERWAAGEQRVTVKLGTTPNDDTATGDGRAHIEAASPSADPSEPNPGSASVPSAAASLPDERGAVEW